MEGSNGFLGVKVLGLHEGIIAKYYTEENIKQFEELIEKLPLMPESIHKLKERYLKTELPKIQSAWERYTHPTEDYRRAAEQLKEVFKRGEK
ncbi:MAG: hypothetical protein LBC51_11570 [Treponema sp.]|nr:hypothetical protein [Treponema sp.]